MGSDGIMQFAEMIAYFSGPLAEAPWVADANYPTMLAFIFIVLIIGGGALLMHMQQERDSQRQKSEGWPSLNLNGWTNEDWAKHRAIERRRAEEKLKEDENVRISADQQNEADQRAADLASYNALLTPRQLGIKLQIESFQMSGLGSSDMLLVNDSDYAYGQDRVRLRSEVEHSAKESLLANFGTPDACPAWTPCEEWLTKNNIKCVWEWDATYGFRARPPETIQWSEKWSFVTETDEEFNAAFPIQVTIFSSLSDEALKALPTIAGSMTPDRWPVWAAETASRAELMKRQDLRTYWQREVLEGRVIFERTGGDAKPR